MLELLPKTSLAKDQKNSKLILYTHAALKGFQTGPAIGIALGGWYSILTRKPLVPSIFLFAGVGLMSGLILVPGLVAVRMNGLKELEWQHRAWRLQRSIHQINTDYLSIASAGLGSILGLGLKRPIGGAGIGSVVGLSVSVVFNHFEIELSRLF
jgi:hypothetical protein